MPDIEDLILCGSVSEITSDDVDNLYEYEMIKIKAESVEEIST